MSNQVCPSVSTTATSASLTQSQYATRQNLMVYRNCDSLCAMIFANRTPPHQPNKFKKRLCAKMSKNLQKLESVGFELNSREATIYRALSARCNYLSQDRCDIAFAAKELCREFAVPSKASYARLKRLARYLVGMPRMIYRYDFQ